MRLLVRTWRFLCKMPRGPKSSVKSFDWLLYPEATTGFSKVELEAIFQKYCGSGTLLPGRRQLFELLNYAKTYPTARAKAQKHDSADKGFGWNMTMIDRRFKYLAGKVNDLEEVVNKRWDDDNKIPVLFDEFVTSSIDTFPWRCQRRKGYMKQRVLYQAKYKCHVLKFQGLIDNIGNFLWWSGPHPGATSDGTIWKNHRPPWLLDIEKVLADKAYSGRIFEDRFNVIPPYKKPRGGRRTPAQSAYNRIHAFYRVKVEHAFGFLKRFDILSRRYRGRLNKKGIKKVYNIMKVLINLSQMKKNMQARRPPRDCTQ